MHYMRDDTGSIRRNDGARLDVRQWRWRPGSAARGAPVMPVDAVQMALSAPGARRLPVAVVGPSSAEDVQRDTAIALGERLGRLGVVLVCGGHGGVMAAAAHGARKTGGLTVGLLPGPDWRSAHVEIDLPIATGLGEARNAVIARSALVLVAVGNSLGTLSEVALGRRLGRTVIGLAGAAEVDGVRHAPHDAAAVDWVAETLLDLADS